MQNSIIKAIIFDFGGVIGTNSNQKIFKAISNEFGIEFEKVQKEYFKIVPLALVNQIPKNKFWKKLSKSLGIEDFTILKSKWIDIYKENFKINTELIDLVKSLKYSGFKVTLLSNLANIYRKITIAKEIEDLFNVVIYSCDIEAKKPNKVIFNKVIEILNIQPNQCIYIDDDMNNLKTPYKMGMNTFLYKTFSQLMELISALCKS